MKTFTRRSALVLGGAAILSFVIGTGVSATTFTKLTYLSFSRTVAVPGATLAPGDYAFELLDSETGRNIVRVSNRTRTKHFALALTRTTWRPTGSGSAAMVTIGEARPGTPAPIRAWYPAGENRGYEFIYGR